MKLHSVGAELWYGDGQTWRSRQPLFAILWMLCLCGMYYWWLTDTPCWCCVCVDCTTGDWPIHHVDVVFVWTVLLVTDRHTRLMLCLCGLYYWWLTDTPGWCCVCLDCTTGDWPKHQVDVVFVWTVLMVTDRHTWLMLCLCGLYYWWLTDTPGWHCPNYVCLFILVIPFITHHVARIT